MIVGGPTFVIEGFSGDETLFGLVDVLMDKDTS